MDLDDITAELAQAAVPGTGSGMLGWDAICAIDLAGLNELLFALYLEDNPAAPVASLQTGFSMSSQTYLLDLSLGPPNLGLSSSGDGDTLAMTRSVLSGAVVQYDHTTGQVLAITELGPEASLVGTVPLTQVSGTVGLGSVQLQLQQGTWELDSTVLDPGLLKAVDAAAASYYQACPTPVTLCAVTQTQVGAWLQPTAFQLLIQQATSPSKSACVLLLITTKGTAGQRQPLATYPIPDGSTAALLVSNQAVFAGLVPSQLNGMAMPATWSAVQTATGWISQVTQGSCDVGVLKPGGQAVPFTTDGTYDVWTGYDEAPMQVPLVGLTLQPQDGKLQANHSQNWGQKWAYIPYPSTEEALSTFPTSVAYEASSPVTIADPATCVVTFPWSTTPTCTTDLSKVQGVFEQDPGPIVVSAMLSKLTPVFKELTVAQVDTFALQNLLFSSQQSLSLSTGSLPGDLLLTGQVTGGITVTPQLAHVTPGGNPVQFTAAGGDGTLEWNRSPLLGACVSGLYTPPAVHAGTTVVKISVSDGTHSGGAVVVLGPTSVDTTPTKVTSAPLTLTTSPSGPVAPDAAVTVTASGTSTTDLRWVAVPPGAGKLEGAGPEANDATFTAAPPADPDIRPGTVRIYAYGPPSGATASFGFVDITLTKP